MFNPNFDRIFSRAQFEHLFEIDKTYLRKYGYLDNITKQWCLPCDDLRFMNHREMPNTYSYGEADYARWAIAVGVELTCNYGSFDLAVGSKFREPEQPEKGTSNVGRTSNNSIRQLSTEDSTCSSRDFGTFAYVVGEHAKRPYVEIAQLR